MSFMVDVVVVVMTRERVFLSGERDGSSNKVGGG